jgi:Flp pilus assembly pilin Flp
MKNLLNQKFLLHFCSQRSGQTLVEYALILAFISIVAIAVLKVLGSKVSSVFSKVNQQLDSAQSAS